MTDNASRSLLDIGAEFGCVLISRADGARARDAVLSRAESAPLDVDFEHVDVIAPGFADEFFVRLPRALTETGRIRIAGLSPGLERVRDFVVRRALESHVSAA